MACALALGLGLSSALLSACGGVPRLRPVSAPQATALRAECRARFPVSTWQAVHTISFKLPLGNRSALIGVLVGDPKRDVLRLVAMAPEGMTLLDVTWRKGRLTIQHAVPPFTNRHLVAGMVRDVRLLFFAPRGQPRAGRLPGGAKVCRWHLADGATVDVLPGAAGAWRAHSYTPKGKLARSVRCDAPLRSGFASQVMLRAHGTVGYSLGLRLVRVTRPFPVP